MPGGRNGDPNVVIVDTTVWIDYLRGRNTPETNWLEQELPKQRIGLTDLILCEILQGLTDENSAQKVYRDLSEFAILESCDRELAVAAARNFRTLRQHGRTVRKTIDGLIATFCLMNGHSLLHCDRDFDHFEEVLKLKVIHP